MLPIDDPTTGAAMVEGYLLLDPCADTAFELGDAAAVPCIPAALTNAHQLTFFHCLPQTGAQGYDSALRKKRKCHVTIKKPNVWPQKTMRGTS